MKHMYCGGEHETFVQARICEGLELERSMNRHPAGKHRREVNEHVIAMNQQRAEADECH